MGLNCAGRLSGVLPDTSVDAGQNQWAYLSVTAPSEALEASLANFASTPRV